jgi:hypothetical protein
MTEKPEMPFATWVTSLARHAMEEHGRSPEVLALEFLEWGLFVGAHHGKVAADMRAMTLIEHDAACSRSGCLQAEADEFVALFRAWRRGER